MCKAGLYVFVFRIKDEKDFFNIMEIVYGHVLFLSCPMCEACRFCKKISDEIPQNGTPIANLSFWIIIFFCWCCNFVL